MFQLLVDFGKIFSKKSFIFAFIFGTPSCFTMQWGVRYKASSFRALSEKFCNGFYRSIGIPDIHYCIQIVDHIIETMG